MVTRTKASLRARSCALAAALLLTGCAGATGARSEQDTGAAPAAAAASTAVSATANPQTTAGTSATINTPADHCPPTDPADTATAAGWLGYLAAHQGDVALVIDDGRGGRLEHRADAPAPAASAAKVLHLAAYADALNSGRLSPDQPVVIRDWEAWFLPGLDGGAHGRALQAIGVANDGVQASDPGGTVPLDDVVTAMIEFSDNAAADFLRELLGDAALLAAGVSASAGGQGGAGGFEVPSYLGAAIALLLPAEAPPPGASREEQAAAELALARRYVDDPGFRAEVLAVPAPAVDAQLQWADNTSAATALAIAAVHRSIYDGAEDQANLGAANARKHLEWTTAPPDTLGLGAKGGSYPGVITEAMTVRRPDGSRAAAVLLVRRMPAADWATGLTSYAHQELLLAAMSDPVVADRLSCAVGAGSTIPG